MIAERVGSDAAAWTRGRASERQRLGMAAVVGFGAVCASGAVDLVLGAVLLALFAATGSIRRLRKNAWVAALAVAGTIASRFHPELAVALAFVTIGALLARAWFVVRNFRVVVLGLLAYGLAVVTALELVPRLRRLLAADSASGWLADLDPSLVGAGLAFVGGALFMRLALTHAGRRGYDPSRAVEVMSILPTVVLGIVLPFATGAFATAGVTDLAAEAGIDRSFARLGARVHAGLVTLRAYAGR